MHIQQPAKTVVIVGATRPEPSLEKEMAARGIRVRWARTIEEAAALLKSAVNRIVVITELALKDGNWRDLLENVRRSSIPVLLVRPTSTAELWWDALDCGVEDILVAPLSHFPAMRIPGKAVHNTEVIEAHNFSAQQRGLRSRLSKLTAIRSRRGIP